MTTLWLKLDAHALAYMCAHSCECVYLVAQSRLCTIFKIQWKYIKKLMYFNQLNHEKAPVMSVACSLGKKSIRTRDMKKKQIKII